MTARNELTHINTANHVNELIFLIFRSRIHIRSDAFQEYKAISGVAMMGGCIKKKEGEAGAL
jgi:hypothetical protein